jgi:acetoin utilization deacetylase AcuC-like enzyme
LKAFSTDLFVLPLPDGHPFPMARYALLRERVAASGLVAPGDLRVPHAVGDAELLRAHDAEYVRRMSAGRVTDVEMRRVGFPWSPQLVERSRRSAGATLEACWAALHDGAGVNLAGGTHHAFRDHGEGYCLFNDTVIAVRALQAEGWVRRAVVIDADVHQGNGTAAICRDDPTIFTFSIHGAKNYPLRKESSDLDIDLPTGTGDREYLDALERGVREAIGRADADLAVYLAGADPYAGDRFGRLAVSMAGLAERDRLVFDAVRAAGLPVAVTMAGGYARRIGDAVAIQYATVRRAAGLAGR